ncbi:phosphotyrosine protein phosphatase [Streptomyces sp. NPDC090046]|uniref:arsenate reductase/protein-tyrosine-phosphatase family protein n=1 Tax=Streptomyces sp. NPDC090046 TaxID=3365928 RepID=UPI0037F213FB
MPLPSSPLLPDERLSAGAARPATRYAGRSQMAAALLAHRAGERVTVSFAGTHPAGEMAPHIAQALTEAGVDLAATYTEPLTEEVVQAADVAVTTGCGDARPVMPGRRHLDRPVADPDGAPIAVAHDIHAIHAIHDAIDVRISELRTRLAP